jgi:hypothetical protein
MAPLPEHTAFVSAHTTTGDDFSETSAKVQPVTSPIIPLQQHIDHDFLGFENPRRASASD